MPGRTGKQCRERWTYQLQPGIKKGGWTNDEDTLLMTLQKRLGNKWTKIAEHLTGRNDSDVKNRWHSNTMRSHRRRVKKLTAALVEEGMGKSRATRRTTATKSPNVHKTPTKKNIPVIPTECPSSALSLSMDSLDSDSVLAASTLSAMKRELFSSPFHENATERYEAMGRRIVTSDNDPPMSFPSIQPSNPVPANDLFSPSYFPRQLSVPETPTPAMSLEMASACFSGPFIPDTPLFKQKTAECINARTTGELFSPDNIDDEEPNTPLPYNTRCDSMLEPGTFMYAV
ncbi:hypothetical protein ACHAXR_008208 [Thalassiosira sp. AJA248-18]